MSWMGFSLLVLGTPGRLPTRGLQPRVMAGHSGASPSSFCAAKFSQCKCIIRKIKSNPSSPCTCTLAVESCGKLSLHVHPRLCCSTPSPMPPNPTCAPCNDLLVLNPPGPVSK